MRNKTKNQIRGAAPGLHSDTASNRSRERRNRGGALALLGVFTVGALLHGQDPGSAENQPKVPAVKTLERGTEANAIQRLVESGAEVQSNTAVVLRPGVRLRDTPVVTDIKNGKDHNGEEVATIHEPSIILKPAYFTGPYGDTFMLVPRDDESQEPYYVSTEVIGMPNEYNKGLPYGESFDIDEDAYTDTGPSTVIVAKGGEPGLAADLSDLHYAQ